MSYDAKIIANFFIKKALSEDTPIDAMKLNKLIYVSYGWYLANYEKSLIKEKIQAWKYGPVIESIYHEFKLFGNNPITTPTFDYLFKNGIIEKENYEIPDDDDKLIQFLDKIWEMYKPFSGTQLSNWSHLPDSPWHVTWYQNGGMFKRNHTITDELIKDYFLDISRKKNEQPHGQSAHDRCG